MNVYELADCVACILYFTHIQYRQSHTHKRRGGEWANKITNFAEGRQRERGGRYLYTGLRDAVYIPIHLCLIQKQRRGCSLYIYIKQFYFYLCTRKTTCIKCNLNLCLLQTIKAKAVARDIANNHMRRQFIFELNFMDLIYVLKLNLR